MSKKKSSQKVTHNKIYNSVLAQDISEHRSMEDKEMHYQHILPVEIENELDLNLQKYSADVKEQIRYILLDLLKYPSTDIAQRHRQSNRLGSFDMKNVINRQSNSSQYSHTNRHPQVCADCGFVVQEANIPICSTIWQFPKVGPGVFHFFEDIKQLSWQIFILGVFYGIIALYTSIIEPTQSFEFSNIYKKVSYIPKMLYSSYNSILSALLALQGWLIVFSIIIWWIMHLIMRCCGQKYEKIVDQQYISPSHFTLMLESVPAYYTKQKLQKEFKKYFQSLDIRQKHLKQWGYELKPCEIQRICKVIPFNLSQNEVMDQQLNGLDKDISQKRRLFAKWMLQFKQNSRFTFQKADRRRQYEIMEKMLQRRKLKVKQMQDKARQHYKLPTSKYLKTTYFVTFKYNQSASIIAQANPQSIAAQIRYFITCCRTAHYMTIKDQLSHEDATLIARIAPDPQDIIWGNLNAPLRFRIMGKLASWGVIILFWGATFGTCYGLNYLSIQNGLTFMPIILAVAVTMFNFFMKFTIKEMSLYERDETYSDRQLGILMKSIIGLLVNWILTPVILTVLINMNIYYSKGLVQFIFFLSITNAIIPPILRILDVGYFIKRLLAYRQMKPYKKMQLRQGELNAYIQYQQYDIGWCYVYFIDIFFFTCFYAPMVAGIIPLSLLGFFLMFWAEKYVLLNRSRRPLISCRTLTERAKSLILLGPMIIGFGGLIWVYKLLPQSSSFDSLIMAAYLTLISVGFLYFITPFDSIFKCLCAVPQEQILSYEQCRSKFTYQYQRMNPATIQQGTVDYYNSMQRKRDQDRQTALNISQGNLVQNFDINYIMEGITKIPNIFGKNTEIASKIHQDDYITPSKAKKNEQVIFINATKTNNLELVIDQVGLEDQKQQKLSRAQTEKKPTIINYNSSGNAYSRRKKHNQRKTISVLEQGYDVILETHSQRQ